MPDQLKHWNGEVVMFAGRNAALSTTLENICDASLLINWATQAPTAARIQISCANVADKGTPTAGTGARTVFIIGLDANYRLQTELMTTDGQAYVESARTWIRVFAAEVSLCGTGLTNAGIIYGIVTGTGGTLTAGVPATLTSCWFQIPAGVGYTTTGIYTVPAGERVRLERLQFSTRAQPIEVQIISHRPLDPADNCFHVENTFAFAGAAGTGGFFEIVYPLPTSMVYDERQDIYFRALSTTAAGVISMNAFFRRIGVQAQRSLD